MYTNNSYFKTQDITLPFKVDKIQFIEVLTELWHADEVEKIPNKNAAATWREAEKFVLFWFSDQE